MDERRAEKVDFVKDKIVRRKIVIFLLCAVCVFFLGCTPTMEVQAQTDGNYSVSYDVALGKVFMDTIASVAGEEQKTSIFDANEFQSQLTASGLANVAVKTPAVNQLAISTQINTKEKGAFPASKIISSERIGGKNQMTLMLSPESVRAIYNALPERTRSYIDLFMSPVITGDTMPKSEYTELVSMVYGKLLADELLGASLSLVLSAPNKKAQQKFSVPIIDLLLLEKPMSFSISW